MIGGHGSEKPYNYSVLPRFRGLSFLSLVVAAAASLSAQTPQPFPRPNTPAPSQPPRTAAPAPVAPTQAPKEPQSPGTPSEATLGVPVYPSAIYLTSYDAGRGQRFYLFGSQVPYADLVTYYRTALKQKGDQLFEAPPTHQFETGRFRDESMAFPPSVTIKDYTYGGSAGFPNPTKGATPERFATIIQIVPLSKD
jgi:hypothetical protein